MKILTEEEKEIFAMTDHTLLAVDAVPEQIRALCDEGLKFSTASICIPPVFVAEAAQYLHGRLPICTVIGFPNGYSTIETKVFESKRAIEEGALEIDSVIPVGLLKAGRFDLVEKEIRMIRSACQNRILKIIIETCLLTEEEKIRMCAIVTSAGADFIKTSTGFSRAGATIADVKLLKKHVGPGVRVKAAGGIASLEDAREMIRAGASRLGTSRMVRIIGGDIAD